VGPKKITLVLATTNEGKAREIRTALLGLPVRVITLAGARIDARFMETGTTFKENALGKSRFYSLKTGFLTLAEDSGLEIEALGGAPGVISARFSGRGATDAKNIRKALGMMKDIPAEKRRGRFICSMVLSLDGKPLKAVTGQVRGTITFENEGQRGFGYDPIFYYRPLRKTFGRLKPREKNAVSHRGRALKKIKAFLLEFLDK
jgi:XTP/dITP diphosphohydrolase